MQTYAGFLSWYVLSTSQICWAWLTPRAFPPPSLLQRQRVNDRHLSLKRTGRGAHIIISPLFGGSADDVGPTPPIPFRDESSFVLAGELPITSITNDDASSSSPPQPIRQSTNSPNPLLSPPRQIPNPYGWMRDDSRTNKTVLDHLHAENEYGQQITGHLADVREELYQEVSVSFVTSHLSIFFINFIHL